MIRHANQSITQIKFKPGYVVKNTVVSVQFPYIQLDIEHTENNKIKVYTEPKDKTSDGKLHLQHHCVINTSGDGASLFKPQTVIIVIIIV